MREVMLFLALTACYRNVYVDRPVVKIEHKVVEQKCVQYAPPLAPPKLDCTKMSYQDCHDLEMARRSDYLDMVLTYLDLYVVPKCLDGVGDSSDKQLTVEHP